MTEQKQPPLNDKELATLENHLESLINRYVDPQDALLGPDGVFWNPISGGPDGRGFDNNELPPYRTLQELRQMRVVGKFFAWGASTYGSPRQGGGGGGNGYAINGYESRINYIVGTGHTYNVVKKNRKIDKTLADRATENVTNFIREWCKKNKWKARQQESQKRADRDGELFFRKFYPDDGYMLLRFVEPSNVIDATGQDDEYDNTLGVRTKLDDIETPIAYNVADASGKGAWVDAGEIQHRKYNVDASLKRGIPLYWPIRHSLNRAVTILRNNSLAIKIQTAIALIRQRNGSKQATQSFLSANRSAQIKNGDNEPKNVFRYPGGSIIDGDANTEYKFPTVGADPEKSVAALQAELRHCAVALQMPEYMFTADASNNNKASSITAETPGLKRFERDQESTIEYDLELINEAIEFAVEKGLLDRAEVNAVRIEASAPELTPRDSTKEAQARETDINAGILSLQTASAKAGYVYEDEQANIASHEEKNGGLPPELF